MKNYWVLAAVVLLVVVILSGCVRKNENTDEIDGGVLIDTGYDAPKSIASAEITSFSCEFSTLTLMEESILENDVFFLEAELSGEGVKGSCEGRTMEKQTFETDASFMEQLQKIVSQYELAQYNGTVYKVSGLPDQFGAYLNIDYASGEQIYASNNQDCFLPLAAMEELHQLFVGQIA